MKQKILVIDDEAAIADTITYALETDGFEPLWSATGSEGLDVIRGARVALVILDIGLPDCNGFDLFKRIRRYSNVPVLFLTARAEEIDRVVGLELGADDYVAKPFSPRELTARVKAILRRVGERNAENVEPPTTPFVVNTEKFTIAYHGKILKLSRYEYKILKLFIERPGHVFTRAKLMDLIWEEAEFSLERTVDTHIKTIRAKLREIDPANDPIHTHRGIGYSLKDEW